MQDTDLKARIDAPITRSQLLREMAASGRKISGATVQNWQRKGHVPLPVRKWHNGATRALYGPDVVETFKRVYDSIHKREPIHTPVVCPHCHGSGVALEEAEASQ